MGKRMRITPLFAVITPVDESLAEQFIVDGVTKEHTSFNNAIEGTKAYGNKAIEFAGKPIFF